MPLPIKPNVDTQKEHNILREKIFAMFKHYKSDPSGILLRSNFEALRPKYLINFTDDEIQSELKNMEKDGCIKIEGDKFILITEK
jgi:Ca2+-binding EF-hand superfamily protein